MQTGLPRRHYRDKIDFKAHESSANIHRSPASPRRDIEGKLISPSSFSGEESIFHVNSRIYPNGIKLVSAEITLNAAAAYTMVFEKWSGTPITYDTDIATASTTAGSQFAEVAADDMVISTIAAGDYIYLDIPATVVDSILVKIIYDIL